MAYELSTPTYQLVLEKQRREAQVASSPRHQPHQVAKARFDPETFRTLFSTDDVLWDREQTTLRERER